MIRNGTYADQRLARVWSLDWALGNTHFVFGSHRRFEEARTYARSLGLKSQ